jgi:hypothetical protein
MKARRGSQRGQVIIIVALMSSLLLGATALAIDLGVQIHDQRYLQNVADTAALAGARDLPGTGCQLPYEEAAVVDALRSVGESMGWSSTWYTQSPNPGSLPSPSGCSTPYASGTLQSPAGHYTVTASSPAATARDSNYDIPGEDYYLGVDIHQTVSNSFAQLMGFATSTLGAHAVGYHYGPAVSEPWALWSGNQVVTSNYPEIVSGDIYAADGLALQSQGQSAVCAELVSGGGSGGHIVIGPAALPPTYPVTGYGTPCPASPSSGSVYAQAAATDCNVAATGVSWSVQYAYCVANPPLEDPEASPPSYYNTAYYGTPIQTLTSGQCSNPSTLLPGIYNVSGSICTNLVISSALNCVSFIFDNRVGYNGPGGPTVDFTGSNGGYIRAFGAGVDPTASYDASTYGLPLNGPYGLNSPCPGFTNTNDLSALYNADNGQAAPTGNCNTQTNYCMLIDGPGNGKPPFTIIGDIEMPNYELYTKSNANYVIWGAAITGDWNDSGGNHPNIVIHYSPSLVTPLPEYLRLVE